MRNYFTRLLIYTAAKSVDLIVWCCRRFVKNLKAYDRIVEVFAAGSSTLNNLKMKKQARSVSAADEMWKRLEFLEDDEEEQNVSDVFVASYLREDKAAREKLDEEDLTLTLSGVENREEIKAQRDQAIEQFNYVAPVPTKSVNKGFIRRGHDRVRVFQGSGKLVDCK